MMTPRTGSAWLLPIVACACSGLPTDPIESAGDYSRSFEHEGLERSYLVHVPVSVDLGRAVPLVVAFHGIPSNAEQMRDISGLDAVADAFGFVVAYPEASEVGDWDHSCEDCSGSGALGYDDVGFTRRLIEKMSRDMSIDRRRIYVTGFSQGALMAFRIACDLAGSVSAVATVGATMLDWQGEHCAPSRAVPILMIHGTADEEFPPQGRWGAIVSAVSVDATVAHWVATDACQTLPDSIDLPDTAADGTTVSRDVYAGCRGNAEVVFYRVDGGGHTWPGSLFNFSLGLGVTSQDLRASDAIADFFLGFAL